VPELGYERAAEFAKKAHKTGQTLREVALEEGVEEETLDRVLDYKRMTEGGVM